MNSQRISLTCAPGGENHRGNQLIGVPPTKGSGLKYGDLKILAKNLAKKYGDRVELHDLNQLSNINTNLFNSLEEEHKANVLIIRDYAKGLTEDIYNECMSDEWDSKYLDPNKYRTEIVNGKEVRLRGKVLNKHARKNICYVKNLDQEPNYLEGKGRIVDLTKKEVLNTVVDNMIDELNGILEANNCESRVVINVVEGNHYYNLKKTGIGFHGDTERVVVICLTIGGGGNYPMRWSWFINGKPCGDPIDIGLNDGDLYIMSEKAVGSDWKKRIIYTLRHAAGCEKYISMKKWKKNKVTETKKKAEEKGDIIKTKLVVKEIEKEGIKINIGLIIDENMELDELTEKMLGKKICNFENYDVKKDGKVIKSGVYYLK
jgi:hypothetical protein